MSISLGQLAIIAGKNTQFQGAPQTGSKALLIGNESGLTCTITMEGGNVQKTLYPSTVDWFAIKPGFSGTVAVVPTALLNNVSSWPASSLIFDAVGLDDPEQASMYPISLSRNTNIGNSVATTGGSTTSVTNDNQALTPSNVFIEATPKNAAGSTISIATDGTVTIKGDVANVLTALLQLIPGAAAGASSVMLGDSARQTEVLGTLLTDGASTFTGDATFNGAGTGLTVTNNELVSGTLTVTGDATFNGAGTGLTVTNNELVSGTLEVTGATDLDSTLDVSGASTLDSGGSATVTTDGNGNLTVGGSVIATGSITANAAGTSLSVAHNFSVLGTSSLDNGKFTTDGNGRISTIPSSTSFSNGTAGAASLTQFFVGSLKLALVLLQGWEKTTAGDSVVSLPTAFTGWVLGIGVNCGPFHLNNSGGVNLTVFSISGFPGAAGSAGAHVSGTAGANSETIFYLPQASAVAQVGLFGSQPATALNGMILLIGQ